MSKLQLAALVLVALSAAATSWAKVTVYFSPRGGCDQAVAALARSATMYLDAACYTFTLESIADELVAARRRGVRVRVIVDQAQGAQASSQAGWLVASGIPVKLNLHHGLMHHKFLEVDGSSVATGSFNWTREATETNDENLVVFTAEPAIARAFAQQFETMWTDTARFADYHPAESPFPRAQLAAGTQPPPRTDDTVYITKTGKKYHRATCPSLGKSSLPIPRSQAKAKGYTPCARCKPAGN